MLPVHVDFSRFLGLSSSVKETGPYQSLLREMEEKTNYTENEIQNFFLAYLRLHKNVEFSPEEMVEKIRNFLFSCHEADTQSEQAQEIISKGQRSTQYFDFSMTEMSKGAVVLDEQKELNPKKPKLKRLQNRAQRRAKK